MLITMFKPTLTFPSILVGASLVVASAIAPVAPPEPTVCYPLSQPRDFVRIEEGTPFVVPTGRLLVLRSIGLAKGNTSGDGQIKIDGIIEYDQVVFALDLGGTRHFTPGWVVSAGSTVETLEPGGGVGALVLLGYLADL